MLRSVLGWLRHFTPKLHYTKNAPYSGVRLKYGMMNYPNWIEGANDKNLIEEFYRDLLRKYPQLREDVEDNEGLLHIDMMALRHLAESFCTARKIEEVRDCFEWVNSYFCRSKNDLLNAFNVSFLEYFKFHGGLSETEFKDLMPPELYRGYIDMMEHMKNMAKEIRTKNEIKT